MVILTVMSETFLLLRRDRVFLPTFVIALAMFGFANLASHWGIEEFRKILYDLGSMGFHLIGVVVAIFWGTKLIADSKREGSLEIQLSSPISRSTWLVGRYFGLCITLLFMAVLLVAAWALMLKFNVFGWMKRKEYLIFAFLFLDWMVIAAVAIFFASMASQAVATFCSLCAWFAGATSASILGALSKDTPEFSRLIVETLAKVWNLQLLNLSTFASLDTFISNHELIWRACYGISLIGILITFACIAFSRRDLTTGL